MMSKKSKKPKGHLKAVALVVEEYIMKCKTPQFTYPLLRFATPIREKESGSGSAKEH